MTRRSSSFLALALAAAACTDAGPSPTAPEPAAPAAAVVTTPGRYQIDLVFDGIFTDNQKAIFRRAAARWEAVLAPSDPWSAEVGTLHCGFLLTSHRHEINGEIDDLMIVVQSSFIDGPGGTLAQAAPCVVRTRGFLFPWDPKTLDYMPIFGGMTIDSWDLEDLADHEDILEAIVVHEMGHGLGIGSGWEELGLLQEPAVSFSTFLTPDTHYSGAAAREAFDIIGGADYAGAKVPIENRGGPGTWNGHWRETVFGPELMTGWISAEPSPLSLVTVRSLEDLGYAVDAAAADAFTLPDSSSADADVGRRFHLGHDLLDVPIQVIDRRGQVRPLELDR